MAFFKSRTGAPITGNEASSFSGNFANLPDNTQARAIIKSFTVQEYMGESYFQLIWKLVDGDFKNCEVKQRITPFEKDDNRAQRNLNMLYRIFNICEHRTDYEDMPQNHDLAEMKGMICSIKIGNGIIQGEERTWVREVWKEGEIETLTGETKVVTGKPEAATAPAQREKSAFDRENERKAAATSVADEDIPF